MASVAKFTDHSVCNHLRHIARTIAHPSNQDIDPERSELNYSLIPDRGMTAFEYYKERKGQLYCFNRADVKTLAGWIVTAPAELPAEELDPFFKEVYNFLSQRYGEVNTIDAIVHKDESGRPHLHFYFIPVVPDQKHGGEKICANEVLSKAEYYRFHTDLQEHLTGCGFNVNVNSGITREQGGNITVKEYKEQRVLEREPQADRWAGVHEKEYEVERGRW